MNDGWELFAEQTLLRWCEAHGPTSEEQMRDLTNLKRRLLVDFDPADHEVGARWFAQRFREEAAKLT